MLYYFLFVCNQLLDKLCCIQTLLFFRRNDFISSVREAAQVALEQIGGKEANQAMYITKVLSDEIRMLTKD